MSNLHLYSKAMLSSNSQLRPRRQRLTFSCAECRRRKVKCDRKQPCTRCKDTRTTCDFNVRCASTRSVTIQAPLHTTNAILLPQPLSSVSAFESSTPHETTFDKELRKVGTHPIVSEPFWLRFVDSSGGILDAGDQKLEDMFDANVQRYGIDTHDVDEAEPFLLSDNVTREPGRAIVNKTRVFGQGHWTTTAHEFQILTRSIINSTCLHLDESYNQTRADIGMLLYKCKALTRETKKQRPSRNSVLVYKQTVQILPSHITGECINLYVTCFESIYRILHIPQLRRDYDKFCAMPDAMCEAESLKVQLAIAIGCSLFSVPIKEIDLISRAHATIHKAQGWLAGPFEKDRLTISGLQVQCLLLLARHCLSIGGDLIWVSLGTLVHSALQMGLNRDPSHFPKMSMSQGEIRRRLWATILEMSLQSALDAGTVPTISMDDFDTTAPGNLKDDELDQTKDCTDQRPETAVANASLQRFLLISWPIRYQLLRCMNGVSAEMPYDTVLQIGNRLKSICSAVKDAVEPQDAARNFKLNLADYCLRRFILSLHRPYALRARQNVQYHYSRKASTDAAMVMLSPIEDAKFSRLVLVAGGTFKIRLRHLALALSSELKNDIDENGPLNTAYRKMLVEALQNAQLEAQRRIESGDWNVRLFMLLSIMLSQAKNVGEARAGLMMAEAAKTALAQAYSIIITKSKLARSPHEITAISDSEKELSDNASFLDLDLNNFLDASSWESPLGMDGWSTLF